MCSIFSFSDLYCRLVAGPLVAGIRGAVFRRYHTRDEAEEAWAQAQKDGIVRTFTLVRRMDERYLRLP